jgi:hypothetical protein
MSTPFRVTLHRTVMVSKGRTIELSCDLFGESLRSVSDSLSAVGLPGSLFEYRAFISNLLDPERNPRHGELLCSLQCVDHLNKLGVLELLN